MSTTQLMQFAIGGAAFGFIEKSFPTLPTIPMLGRSGTIAVAIYLLKGRGLVRDIGIAAATIAGYQLGAMGRISGGMVVPQVSGGVAAQV